MKVQRCSKQVEAPEKLTVPIYSYAEIQLREGVYRPLDWPYPGDRLITFQNGDRKITMYYETDNHIIGPASLNIWDEDRFVKTDEVVCFELRAK